MDIEPAIIYSYFSASYNSAMRRIKQIWVEADCLESENINTYHIEDKHKLNTFHPSLDQITDWRQYV